MNWNKRNIAVGIMFIILALVCLSAILRHKYDSYYITGVVIFTIVALGFLKRARK